MIRNLKVLLAAAMALAAFGVFSASGAQAAEFHCSVEPCQLTVKSDGTGKTAHHVFDIRNGIASASITCAGISAEATSSKKTATELTVTNIKYLEPCTLAGSPATVSTNGCHYLFTSHGTVSVRCPEGKAIVLTAGACVVEFTGAVGGANQNLHSVSFHNIGEESKTTTEVTVETVVKNVDGTAKGCEASFGIPDGTFTEGEYTTGNAIVTGETDPGGVMANAWWA